MQSEQYELTEEQKMLQREVRILVKEKIEPRAAEIDRTGIMPPEIFQQFRELGLCGISIPSEYGGGGKDMLTSIIVQEEVAKACFNSATIINMTELACYPILIGGSEQQKRKYIPKLASGEHIACFCLTEPEAGSDSAAMKTRAVLDGNEYVIDGTKHFITEADISDIFSVFAKTDVEAQGVRGISAFVVEKGAPGLSIGKHEDKLGFRGLNSCEVIFENCRIPKENLLGEEGQGFYIAMQTLDMTRPMVGGLAIGVVQGALDYAIEYAKQRIQFGKPIAALQGIQFKVTDIAMQVEAARQLVYKAACLIDHLTAEKDWAKDRAKRAEVSKWGAMAKCFATDVAARGTSEALQVLGGYGYMKDFPMERYFRDARLMQITEGTNEIQRVVIAASLFR